MCLDILFQVELHCRFSVFLFVFQQRWERRVTGSISAFLLRPPLFGALMIWTCAGAQASPHWPSPSLSILRRAAFCSVVIDRDANL